MEIQAPQESHRTDGSKRGIGTPVWEHSVVCDPGQEWCGKQCGSMRLCPAAEPCVWQVADLSLPPRMQAGLQGARLPHALRKIQCKMTTLEEIDLDLGF